MTEPFQYRNADGSLRLDEALGERCVRHYTRILASSSEEFAAMQLAMAQAPPEPAPGWPPWPEPDPGLPVIDGLVLTREGTGPEVFSCTQDLALLPGIIWDVCGYYRALGFHWSQFRQVTARAIRLRYLELDPRQEDAELFYAASQLLDPVIRRAYDLQPLGGLFLGDRGVRLLHERLAALEASRRTAEAAGRGQDGETTQGEVLHEWGFEKPGLSGSEARERLRDQHSGPAEDEPLPGSPLGESLEGTWGQQWSWYVLSDPRDPMPLRAGTESLEAWQAMVCSGLAARGVTGWFSVGLWPGPGPKVWRDSKKSCIFFTGDEPPTQRQADQAIQGYLAQAPATGRRAHRMAIFTEGDVEAEAINEEIAASRKRRFRIQTLAIKDGDDILLRFVTDRVRHGDHPGWITVGMHSFIPTKPKPDEVTWKWPESFWGICRNDRIFQVTDPADPRKRLDEYEGGYGDCWIHEQYAGVKGGKFNTDMSVPKTQTLGLAVLREPALDSNGAVIGFKNQMVEWEDDEGNIFQVPHFVIISQRYPAFWGSVSAACYLEPRTATDKDFRVKRKGNEYTISGIGQTPDHRAGTASWAAEYEDVLAKMNFNLGDWVVEHSTRDHYARWFIPGEEPEGGYGRRDGSTEEGKEAKGATAPQAPQVDQEAMADFAATLKARGK